MSLFKIGDRVQLGRSVSNQATVIGPGSFGGKTTVQFDDGDRSEYQDSAMKKISSRSKTSKIGSSVDKDAALELSLYIDNDDFMYRRRKSFLDNVKTKIKRGKYDASKAPALWQYFVDEGARRYVKEYAGPGDVRYVFNKPTRSYLAGEYARIAYHNIRSGEE